MLAVGPLVHREIPSLPTLFTKTPLNSSLNYPRRNPLSFATTFKSSYRPVRTLGATETDAATTLTQNHHSDIVFTDTFPIRRAEKVTSS